MLVPAVDPSALRATAPIGPLDRLEVIVFREPELSVADTPVDESGRIMLPLAGEFSAAGKSAQSLATEISQRLRQYLRNPEVAVRVKQAASKRITVAGSVMQPGVFPVEGRVTLLQAVALARGPSQVADLDTTLIFRTQNGQKTVAKFDIGAISRGKAPDPEVLPGDTIAVGSSGLKTAWRDITMGLRSFNIFRIIP
ncbi:MAG: polysaccharide biosynthesis/export family protein [Sphingomicrobium sp.]